MDDEVDEVVAEFLMESHENLDQLDNDFIALEEHPHDRALLASVFRTIHTIKGTCGFLGFSHLESLTHAGEHLLSQLRTGALTLDGPRTSALLAMVDAVRTMMRHIEQTGSDGDAPSAALIAELERLSHPDPAPAEAAPVADHVAVEAAQEDHMDDADQHVEAPAPEAPAPAAKAPRKKATKKAPVVADTPPPAPVEPVDTIDDRRTRRRARRHR